MDRKTATLLHDALVALDEIDVFTAGLSREEFDQQRCTQLIVERLIIKVGGVLSQATRSLEHLEAVIPGIPDIIELRDHVVRVYWNIDVDRVWNLVVTKAPELARLLRNLLAEQASPLPERRVQR